MWDFLTSLVIEFIPALVPERLHARLGALFAILCGLALLGLAGFCVYEIAEQRAEPTLAIIVAIALGLAAGCFWLARKSLRQQDAPPLDDRSARRRRRARKQ